MGTGGMSAQMEPSASVHGEQARLLSICGTYSPGGFEPVGAAFRDGGGCWESRGEQAPRGGSCRPGLLEGSAQPWILGGADPPEVA